MTLKKLGVATMRVEKFPLERQEEVHVVLKNVRSGATLDFEVAAVEARADHDAGVMYVTVYPKGNEDGAAYTLSMDRWSLDVSPVSPGSVCVLTTACVTALGLPDDCHELKAFRLMRDHYVRSRHDGPAAIVDYYRTAPFVIAAIDARSDASQRWTAVYKELVAPVTMAMDHGHPDMAADLALRVYDRVKRQYGVE